MRELAITLEERKNCPGRQQILPVYLDFTFGLNYEEMYTNMTWPDGRPDSSNLKAWAENLSKVSEISGLRPDQVSICMHALIEKFLSACPLKNANTSMGL